MKRILSIVMAALMITMLFTIIPFTVEAEEEWTDWLTEDQAPSVYYEVSAPRTEYKYRTKTTTTSYSTSLLGYINDGYSLTDASSSTISYVSKWPSGFNTSNSLYKKYNKSAVNASESDTQKIVVNSTSTQGYIYWHWCRGSYTSGPINRAIAWKKTSEFSHFDAFENSSAKSYNSSANAYKYSNSSVCKDTYWWNGLTSGKSGLVTIKKEKYTTYKKKYNYYKWTDGDWTTTKQSESSTIELSQTRVTRRYRITPNSSEIPVVSIQSTNELSDTQNVTCLLSSNKGIDGYYLGTAANYNDNPYTKTSEMVVKFQVSNEGTYYLTAKDSYGNVSETQHITFYKTELNLNGGTTDSSVPLIVLSAEDSSFTPSVPEKNDYVFKGWSKSVSDVSGSDTITPNGNDIYYALWEEVNIISGSTGVCEWKLNKKEKTLTVSGEGEMDSFSSYTKTPWYPYKSYVENVVFEKGVKNIGANSFLYYSDMKSAEISDSVTDIEENAFSYCTGLVTAILPNSIKTIDCRAFSACSKLSEIGNIPNQIEYLGDDAFRGCSSLTSVTIPASLSYLGKHPFLGCKLLSEVNVDNDNQYYTSLDGVLFDKDKKQLLQYPLGKESEEYVLPESVTEIGSCAFYSCDNIYSIILKNNRLTDIEEYAFYNCSNLTRIELPNSLEEINDYAFQNCNNLQTLSLCVGVYSIGNSAFENCTKINTINFYGSESEWAELLIGDNNSSLTSASIHFFFTESSNGIVKGSDNTGEGQSYTTTLSNGERATIRIIDSVLYIKVDTHEYTFKIGNITKTADSAVINEKDSLLHIITLGGTYYVFDLLTGNQIMAYRNTSTGNYCLSGNLNAYSISAKSFVDNNNYNEIISGGSSLSKKLMSRDEYNAISLGKEPIYDTTPPTCSISSTNNLTDSQTATLTLSDNVGIAGYYWGTNPNYSSNTYTGTSSTSITKTISSSGTYYLTVKDTSDNISDTKSITFYSTSLNANGCTLSSGTPSSVLAASGNSFTPYEPTRSGYTFVGWNTSSTATTGSKTITPTSNSIYYAIWKDTNAPTVSITNRNLLKGTQTVDLDISDNSFLDGYYWGTNSNYSNNAYTKFDDEYYFINLPKTITNAGTYYLTAKDSAGNISETVSISLVKTTFDANNGTVTPTSVLTESGVKISLPTPVRTNYIFNGWSTSITASSGVTEITPTSNNTYYAIWSYNDVTKPTCSISSTNNLASSQTVKLSWSDNVGIAGYYWGTNSNYSSNTYTSTLNSSVTKIISLSGTYYLTTKDTNGNVSDTQTITFYRTNLSANGGTLASGTPSPVITAKGNSFTPLEPYRNGYTFVSWNENSLTGSKTITPTSDSTYYAIWQENVIETTAPVPTTEPIESFATIPMFSTDATEGNTISTSATVSSETTITEPQEISSVSEYVYTTLPVATTEPDWETELIETSENTSSYSPDNTETNTIPVITTVIPEPTITEPYETTLETEPNTTEPKESSINSEPVDTTANNIETIPTLPNTPYPFNDKVDQKRVDLDKDGFYHYRIDMKVGDIIYTGSIVDLGELALAENTNVISGQDIVIAKDGRIEALRPGMASVRCFYNKDGEYYQLYLDITVISSDEPTELPTQPYNYTTEPQTTIPEVITPTIAVPTTAEAKPTEKAESLKKLNQTIFAKSYKKTYGSKAFKINAKSSGGTKLTYKSSSKKVATVSLSGKVTIKGCGKAKITIIAASNSLYKSASKKITVTVKPGKIKYTTREKYTKNGIRIVKVNYKPQKNCDGYEAQISFRDSFKEIKSAKLKKTKKTVVFTKVTVGTKYYLRLRAYKKIGGKKTYGKWSKTSFTA